MYGTLLATFLCRKATVLLFTSVIRTFPLWSCSTLACNQDSGESKRNPDFHPSINLTSYTISITRRQEVGISYSGCSAKISWKSLNAKRSIRETASRVKFRGGDIRYSFREEVARVIEIAVDRKRGRGEGSDLGAKQAKKRHARSERKDERKAVRFARLRGEPRYIDGVQDGPYGYPSPANFLERETMRRRR